jgi:hypothetical protein
MRRSTLFGPASLALASVIALGLSAFLLTQRSASAEGSLDLSGAWTLQVDGIGQFTCDAVIEQTGDAFEMGTECSGLGSAAYSGTVDPKTGEFTATGFVIIAAVELAGTVAPDAESMSGTWSAPDLAFSGTFTAERKPPPATPTPRPTLSAPVDVSGTWDITVFGFLGGSCVAVIEQNGTELTGVASCDFFSDLYLTGTVDPATGGFTLSDGSINIEGAVAEGGNELTADWNAFDFVAGTLTGVRTEDAELIDLNGEWEAVLEGDTPGVCTLSIHHELFEGNATLSCGEAPPLTMSGNVGGLSGYLSFQAEVNGTYHSLFGEASLDRSYLMGSYSLYDYAYPEEPELPEPWPPEEPWAPEGPGVPGEPGTSGFYGGGYSPFVAVPSGRLAAGIVGIDCSDFEPGMQPYCIGFLGETATLSIHVAAAPADAHDRLTAALTLPEFLGYDVESVSAPGCESLEVLTGSGETSLRCVGVSAGGAVVTLPLTCSDYGDGNIGLIATFALGEAALPAPASIDAEVHCYRGGGGGPESGVGDANCDGWTNSIDAALVLQLNAGLIDSLPCYEYADTDSDGEATSLDAAVILQIEAGYIVF